MNVYLLNMLQASFGYLIFNRNKINFIFYTHKQTKKHYIRFELSKPTKKYIYIGTNAENMIILI